MPWLFSDFSCFDMSLLLLTVTLRGVSNKHCLLSFFSLKPVMLKSIEQPIQAVSYTEKKQFIVQSEIVEVFCVFSTRLHYWLVCNF